MQAVDRQQHEGRVIGRDDRDIDRISHRTIRTVGGVIVLSALLLLAPAAPLPLYAAATLVWLALLRDSSEHVVASALLLRVAASVRDPVWSGDVYRYLWDGTVILSGIHPYRYAPIDPSLLALRPEWFDRINHPDIATVYPTYAEGLFALSGGSLVIWRGLLIAMDLWTIGVLSRRDRRVAFAYATAPLVLFEGFWSAHVEIAAIAFLLSGVGVPSARRPTSRRATEDSDDEKPRGESAGRRHHDRRDHSRSAVLVALAAGIKLTPLAALPALLRDCEHRLRYAGVFLLFFIAPMALLGIMPGLLPYATRWSFNSPLYLLAKWIAEQIPAKAIWTAIKDPLHLETISDAVYRYLHPDFIARGLLAIGFVLVLTLILRRVRDPHAAVADSLAALLLFSPTIHPWYWLVVIPFALLASRSLWLWLAVFSPVSYLMYEPSHDNGDPSQTVVMLLCYSIPAIGWLLTRSRLRHEKTR